MQVPTWAGALTNHRGIRFTEMTRHGAPDLCSVQPAELSTAALL